MTDGGIWVDTDFGFDDLWALLLLRHLKVEIAGVSLVHGNTPIEQVCRNAAGAIDLFKLPWPVYHGASAPLHNAPQTAQRILGQSGMRTRGLQLPEVHSRIMKPSAKAAFANWLCRPGRHRILALGPLSNLAIFCSDSANDINRIERITWMGGSAARGNHTRWAEFNAVCDPHAVGVVLDSGVPIDVIDLELCRTVQFAQLPSYPTTSAPCNAQPVLNDLLGGYLDIALERGRDAMNIYDPLAALALAGAVAIEYQAVDMTINVHESAEIGRTLFTADNASVVRLARSIDSEQALSVCMNSLDLQTTGFAVHH